MKFFQKIKAHSTVIVLLTNFALNLCCAEKSFGNYQGLKINGVLYQNGQTAYIDCTTSPVIISGEYTPDNPYGYNPNNTKPAVREWNTSSNFTYVQRANGFQIILTLGPDKSDGHVTATFFVGGDVVTVYLTQRPTPTLTIAPTLCNPGQSGDFSATLNFYGQSSANVIWQTTGGVTVNGGSSYRINDNTISRATVQLNSYGTLTLYGEIPGCNNIQTKAVRVHIGTPSSSDVTFRAVGVPDPSSYICGNSTISFQSTLLLPQSQYSYNWTFPFGGSNVSYFYSSGPNATIQAASTGGFVLQMDITNLACNSTGSTSRTFGIQNCDGSFRVANNPANTTITALFDPTEEDKYLPNTIRLSHEKKGVLKEMKIRGKYSKENIKSGLQLNFDVQNLPKDTYYLQGLYDDGKVQSIRVVVN